MRAARGWGGRSRVRIRRGWASGGGDGRVERDRTGVGRALAARGDTPIYRSAANYAGRVGRPPPPVDASAKVAAAVVRLADRPRTERSVGLANGFIRFGFTAMPPAAVLARSARR